MKDSWTSVRVLSAVQLREPENAGLWMRERSLLSACFPQWPVSSLKIRPRSSSALLPKCCRQVEAGGLLLTLPGERRLVRMSLPGARTENTENDPQVSYSLLSKQYRTQGFQPSSLCPNTQKCLYSNLTGPVETVCGLRGWGNPMQGVSTPSSAPHPPPGA